MNRDTDRREDVTPPPLKIDLPPGYVLSQDRHGVWDIIPDQDLNIRDPQVLAELSRLRAELERVLSGGAPADDAEGDEEWRPWETLDTDWVLSTMARNVTGDAEVYATMHKGRVAIDISSGGPGSEPDKYVWSGHHWRLDQKEAVSHSYVEHVALAYQRSFRERTESPLKKKIGQLEAEMETTEGDSERKIIEDSLTRLKETLAGRRKSLKTRIDAIRTPSREASIIKKCRSITGWPLNCGSEQMDANPNLLAVRNGVIDLETGAHRAGRPDDWLVRSSPVEWAGANFPCEPWLKFLREVFSNPETGEPCDELVDFVQRLLGYSLLGEARAHIMPIFTGRGRNGKGTIMEMMGMTLGPLAGPIPSELLLDQGTSRSADSPSPSIMMLKGLRLAVASETAEGRRFSLDRVKWLSGGDKLTGRWPNDKYPTSFNPTHLMFLLTNALPTVPTNDYAFWERVLNVPFQRSFVDHEPREKWESRANLQLKDELKECLPGILAWLVKGHLWWRRDGLNPPPIVLEATKSYREGEDTLGDFLEECCLMGEGLKEGSSRLYKVFCEWHQPHVGKYPPSQKKFGRQLQDRGFERIKSGTIVYRGLELQYAHKEGYAAE